MKLAQLSDRDIVVYALFLLGGYQRRIHTEDIAIKCFEIARDRFSWTKYPQYPDIQPVRFALEKSKPLIIGSSERKRTDVIMGWRLTKDGLKWIEENKNKIEESIGNKQIPTGRLTDSKRVKTLLTSSAFKKYQECAGKCEMPHVDIIESLNCTVNTKPEVIFERIDQLSSISHVLKQQQAIEYLDYCQKRCIEIWGQANG